MALVRRQRVKVIVGEKVSTTGEIKPRAAWRTMKTLVAAVRTRVGEWSLVPKRHEQLAVALAEQRFLSMTDMPDEAQAPQVWHNVEAAIAALGLAVQSPALPASG